MRRRSIDINLCSIGAENEIIALNYKSSSRQRDAMSIAQSNTGSHQYGAGIYRRRITIKTKDQQVNVEMEDDPHGFKLQLNHDKQKITDIQVETLRYPYDTCPGATDKVRSLIGNSLSAVKNLSAVAKAREHCTHQFDLLQLAIDYAHETGSTYQYDIAIPDEKDDQQRGTISDDNGIVHDWHISKNILVSPENLKNRPLMRGFYAWVAEEIPEDMRRAAEMLQRGFIVATSRRVDMEIFAEQPVNLEVMPIGACYSLQLGTIEHAHRKKNVVRDFSNREEMLLQFE